MNRVARKSSHRVRFTVLRGNIRKDTPPLLSFPNLRDAVSLGLTAKAAASNLRRFA
jgi:hypothetical protein